MKVVALVSGGKDSCFSMRLCEVHGHQVVALANLLPADSEVDELDSYMYQTVGHQLVAGYAIATGLPLYRKRILGCSNSQGLSYAATSGDEVEDLHMLLAYVKEHHPDITAVVSGAIASDYQRLRVESVCSRLGLVSLAYLWHQPQDQLLSDMIANNIEAVLVKVAAIGLDPHEHLGKSIRELQPHLRRLRDQFGCNVCGEGGEYETLTLDCPAFKYGRIVLDDWQVKLHSPDSIAPVGVLHPLAFHLQKKHQPSTLHAEPQHQQQQQPPESVVTEVPEDWQPQQPPQDVCSTAVSPQRQQDWHVDLNILKSALHMQIVASVGPAGGQAAAEVLSSADTAAALGVALSAVTARLPGLGLTWQTSLFVHLYLSDMEHFGAANAEYCKHLPQLNPPSRACVQVPLAAGCLVLLDVLFAKPHLVASSGSSQQPAAAVGDEDQLHVDRQVLHVQSISSWAPSCIGPYSQATSCNGLIYMAGQIPLDPATMNIIQPTTLQPALASPTTTTSTISSSSSLAIACQAWRTLRSCQAVAVAMRSCFATASLCLTVYLSDQCATAGGQAIVQAALEAAWRDRELLGSPDIPAAVLAAAEAGAAGNSIAGNSSSQQQGAGKEAASKGSTTAAAAAAAAATTGDSSDIEGSEDGICVGAVLDDYLRPPAMPCPVQPAVVYVSVPALPRGALLEVQPVLLDLSAAAAREHESSSSSDDDHSTQQVEGNQPDALLSPKQPQQDPDVAGPVHGSQALITLHVSPINLRSYSSWKRVLVHCQQLQDSHDATGRNVDPRSLAEATASQLAAAVVDCFPEGSRPRKGQQAGGPQQQVCMLRCYHTFSSNLTSAAASDYAGEQTWQLSLTAQLQQLLNQQQQQDQVAVQFVPVSSVASSVQDSVSCCIVLEMLVC